MTATMRVILTTIPYKPRSAKSNPASSNFSNLKQIPKNEELLRYYRENMDKTAQSKNLRLGPVQRGSLRPGKCSAEASARVLLPAEGLRGLGF